jgi:hypothetical protein
MIISPLLSSIAIFLIPTPLQPLPFRKAKQAIRDMLVIDPKQAGIEPRLNH